MSNQVLTLKLLPHQLALINAKEREVLCSGSWGSAKTSALCYAVLKECMIPNTTILLCRKTYTSLRRTTLDSLLYGQNPILPKGSYQYNKAEQKITLNGLNSSIYMTGLEDIMRVRSMNLSMVAVDECSELSEDDWMELIGRLRNNSGSRKIIGATNPATPSHFLYKRFFIDKNKNRKLIQSTTLDNPYLAQDYIDSLKDLSESMYNRFVLGQWINLEHAVYKEWNRKLHIKERQIGEFHSFYLGVDFGFTNPCAFGLFGLDGDDNLHLLEDNKEKGLLIGQIVKRCDKYEKFEPKVIVDPSAPALIAEFEQAGFNVVKANNDVESGIARLQNYLSQNKFTVNPKCEQFVDEIENYQYCDKGKPVKVNDHLMDSTRYVINDILDNKQSHTPLMVLGSHDSEFA